MIVVADTSPLNYLVLIDKVDLLPKLFQQVVVPIAVSEELTHAAAPSAVRQWMRKSAGWLEVRSPALKPDQGLANSAYAATGESQLIKTD